MYLLRKIVSERMPSEMFEIFSERILYENGVFNKYRIIQ